MTDEQFKSIKDLLTNISTYSEHNSDIVDLIAEVKGLRKDIDEFKNEMLKQMQSSN